MTESGIGPGTIGRRIFIPGNGIAPAVLDHELAHINAGHRFDLAILLISRIFFWPSPAHWLLGRELKIVHEFEADAIAAGRTQTDVYLETLMQTGFGIPQIPLSANAFFHHPLKRRIMMLRKNTPARHSRAALLAAVLLATSLTGSVLVAQTRNSASTLKSTTPDPDALRRIYWKPQAGTVDLMTGGQMVFTIVEQMPRFDGEIWNWLQNNAQGPEKNIEGKVVVQFTVDPTGNIVQPAISESSTDPRLNAEALRLVNAMPRWKPGIQRGSPVAVRCTLPIYFGGNGAGC